MKVLPRQGLNMGEGGGRGREGERGSADAGRGKRMLEDRHLTSPPAGVAECIYTSFVVTELNTCRHVDRRHQPS